MEDEGEDGVAGEMGRGFPFLMNTVMALEGFLFCHGCWRRRGIGYDYAACMWVGG